MCHAGASSLSQPCWSHRQTGRLLVSPGVGASLSDFQVLSNLNSINVCLLSPLTPSLPVAFLPALSISTAETYYCVISEVALAPDSFSECISSILLSRIVFFFKYFSLFSFYIMCRWTWLRSPTAVLHVCFPVISQRHVDVSYSNSVTVHSVSLCC